VYHPPASRLPLGGSSIAGAPQAVGPQDTVEAHGSKGPSDGVAGGDKVPVSGAAVTAGAAAQVTVGGGSPTLEVLPDGDTNVTTEEVAAGDPASSTGLAGGAFPPPQRLTAMSSWRSLGSF
jgi:hypothetical protein